MGGTFAEQTASMSDDETWDTRWNCKIRDSVHALLRFCKHTQLLAATKETWARTRAVKVGLDGVFASKAQLLPLLPLRVNRFCRFPKPSLNSLAFKIRR